MESHVSHFTCSKAKESFSFYRHRINYKIRLRKIRTITLDDITNDDEGVIMMMMMMVVVQGGGGVGETRLSSCSPRREVCSSKQDFLKRECETTMKGNSNQEKVSPALDGLSCQSGHTVSRQQIYPV